MTDKKNSKNSDQDTKNATQDVQELLERGDSLGLAIDTNIYIESGVGSLNVSFRSQLAGCKGRFLHLCPSVWEREIKKHLRVGIDRAKDKAKSVSAGNIASLDSAEANAAIKSLQDAASKIDSNAKANSIWDNFAYETHIKSVPVPVDSANTVLDWYFEQRLPFEGVGDKKNEFPDAFALHSLSRYAKDNDLKKVVVITKDNGAYRHCEADENLLPFRDVQSALGAFDKKELIDQRRKLSEIASRTIANRLLEKLKNQFVDRVNLPYQHHQRQAWRAITTPNFQQNPRIMIDELIEFDLIPSGNFELPVNITNILEDGQVGPDRQTRLTFRIKVYICAKISCEISAIDINDPNNQKFRQSFSIENPVETEVCFNFSICFKRTDGISVESALGDCNRELPAFDFDSVEIEPTHVNVPGHFEDRGFA